MFELNKISYTLNLYVKIEFMNLKHSGFKLKNFSKVHHLYNW